MHNADVIVLGAGAAGLMCAIEAGKRGRRVVVLEKSNKPGRKILMSGGGRCNFTNFRVTADQYISHNPHFCKSALSRYTQWDFIELVNKHQVPFHEKAHGQLFCDLKAQAILNILLQEAQEAHVTIETNKTVSDIQKVDQGYLLTTQNETWACESLVIATGGLSIPTMGASAFGYEVAKKFGLQVRPTRAGLVPFTLNEKDLARLSILSGISMPSTVSHEKIDFKENILFTHRGLSGPAILQISSYWQEGESIEINMLPECPLSDILKNHKQNQATKSLKTVLLEWFPKRLLECWFPPVLLEKKMAELSHKHIEQVAAELQAWQLSPPGTEGYKTAEVTLGGVDCSMISSKTMEARSVPGLFFIGEVLDVTGWLGGYNFQWAWSSGWAAGQVV